jgi:hypothetical protein
MNSHAEPAGTYNVGIHQARQAPQVFELFDNLERLIGNDHDGMRV